jgi:hypothetical protein
MTKIIDSNIDRQAAYDQYDDALKAVVDRALSKAEIYTNTVGDQFLYVAMRVMMEDRESQAQGVLEWWCDRGIQEIDHQYRLVCRLIEVLSGKDDE